MGGLSEINLAVGLGERGERIDEREKRKDENRKRNVKIVDLVGQIRKKPS